LFIEDKLPKCANFELLVTNMLTLLNFVMSLLQFFPKKSLYLFSYAILDTFVQNNSLPTIKCNAQQYTRRIFGKCHGPTQPQLELELDLIMGRNPPHPRRNFFFLNEDDLKKINGKRPKKKLKMEDDLNIFF
jgi:hypothetical protein